MAVKAWYDACKQILPKWLPARVQQRESPVGNPVIELHIGTPLLMFVMTHNDAPDVPLDHVHRVVGYALQAWLVAMRDRCNAELGETHVPREILKQSLAVTERKRHLS